jgi:iron complex outermembrane receptor protein
VNTTPYNGGIVTYDVAAAGFMWQWQIAPSLELTNAVRKDRLELGRSGAVPSVFGFTNADWDRTIDATSFNSGLVWGIAENDTIRVTAARGAQLPNLFNLGGQLIEFPNFLPPFDPPLYYIAGLPTLNPTVVTNVELAWEHALPALGVDLELAVFSGETRNVVADTGAFDLARAIVSAPANIGDSKARGFEVSAHGTFATHGRWRAGYLREDIEDRFDTLLYPTFATYRDFEATTPERTVNLGVGWSKGRWEADVYALYRSYFAHFRAPTTFDFTVIPDVLVDVPSHVSVDGRLAYKVKSNMTLSLSGQNLTRGEQRQTSGPLVERRVAASFDVAF